MDAVSPRGIHSVCGLSASSYEFCEPALFRRWPGFRRKPDSSLASHWQSSMPRDLEESAAGGPVLLSRSAPLHFHIERLGATAQCAYGGLSTANLSSALRSPQKLCQVPGHAPLPHFASEKENLGVVLKDHRLFVFIFTELKNHTKSSYGLDLKRLATECMSVCTRITTIGSSLGKVAV